MKRNLLALAIPALLAAGAANASIEVYNKDGHKVTFNGKVDVKNYLGNKEKADAEGNKTVARLGFNGQTKISDSLTGYGRFEYETTDDSDTANNKVRYAFAGLDFGTAGQLDYGKNDGVLKSIKNYTDVLPVFGGDFKTILASRERGTLTYRNSKLVDGLSFALQYSDDTDGDKEKATDAKNRERYGFNVQYSATDLGIKVGAGYATTSKDKGKKSKVNAYLLGAAYDANDLYVAALLARDTTKTSADSKTKKTGIELVAQYAIQLDAGKITPSLAYAQGKQKTDSQASKKLYKYVAAGATYAFNKNLSFVAEYKFNLLKEKDTDQHKDTLGLGLSYSF